MTPAPGKKRGRKPSALPHKVRTTITLDPAVKAAAESSTTNFSDLVETLLRKELKRLSKRHPADIDPKREGPK